MQVLSHKTGNLNSPLLLFLPIHLAAFLYFAPGSAFDLTSKGYLVEYFFILMYLVGYFITLTYLAGHMPAPSPGRRISSSNSSCTLGSFGSGATSDLDIDSSVGCDSCDFSNGTFCFGQHMVQEGFGILFVLWIHIF